MTANIKRGIVLMNLGSPDSPDKSDVKKYLDQFLMDERVIDKSWLVRALLVKGIIIPLKVSNSSNAYKSIWTKEGSPLIQYTRELQSALQQKITEPVEIVMRYGNPTIETAFENLLKKFPGIEEVIAMPLYPHYAMSSYETAVEHAKMVHRKKNYSFRLVFIKPVYKEKDYIHALAESIKPFIQQSYDQILFSYHGIPERHILKSDVTGTHCLQSTDCCTISSAAHEHCYRHQCFTTTRLVTERLGISKEKYSVSFQSRLGKGWLQPFTDIRLKELPGEGIKKLLVICPAFVSDCLETLEEIADRGKEIFIEAGGTDFVMIRCLNSHPLWVEAIKSYINEIAAGNHEMLLETI